MFLTCSKEGEGRSREGVGGEGGGCYRWKGGGVGIFIGLFRGTSHPRMPYLSIMNSFGLN